MSWEGAVSGFWRIATWRSSIRLWSDSGIQKLVWMRLDFVSRSEKWRVEALFLIAKIWEVLRSTSSSFWDKVDLT